MPKKKKFDSAFGFAEVTPEQILSHHRARYGGLRMEDDPEPVVEPAAEGTKTPPGDPADLGEPGKRALQAERDGRTAEKKRADAAEAKLAEHAAAQLTDQQRIEKERDDAKSAASESARKFGQYDAAAEAGLPLSWAKRVTGNTPEERLADAKAMAAEIAESVKPGTPKHDPSQGRGGDGVKGGSVQAAKDEYLASRKK